MRDRSRSLLILIVLFGLLFSLYWFVFKDKKPPSDTNTFTQDEVKLYSFGVGSVQSIEWIYNSSKSSLTRVGDNEWKLLNPAIAADNAKLSQFVSTIVSLTGTRKYPFSEVSRKDAGLESPQFTAVITLEDGVTHSVSIGKQTVDDTYYYVTADNLDFSTLVSRYIIDSLLVDPYTFGASPTSSPEPSN